MTPAVYIIPFLPIFCNNYFLYTSIYWAGSNGFMQPVELGRTRISALGSSLATGVRRGGGSLHNNQTISNKMQLNQLHFFF